MRHKGIFTPAIFFVMQLAGCSAANRVNAISAPPPASQPALPSAPAPLTAKSTTDSARYSFTAADVDFMTGMITHHEQAIVMSRMAPSHGASHTIEVLAARITNSQADEIVSMKQWLRDHGQPVPKDSTGSTAMQMPGMQMPGMQGMNHEMLMPGMLTPAQMKQLDAARGVAFDRLFLQFMIQHHRGAITMVDKLFSTEGAAQDQTVFKFASDVNVDQQTEIDRMEKILASL